MKTKLKKRISMLIFLVGFGIFLYPIISKTFYEYYFHNEAVRITEDFVNDEFSESLYNEQLAYNESAISNPEEIEMAEVSVVEENLVQSENVDSLTNENVLGILSIPAINLVYPIYDGATEENLLKGVARIEGTSYPVGGINTNSVISGHKGYAGQIFFSKIDQLVAGDLVHIQNRKETLVYEVYNTAKIKADDVAALAVIPGQDTVTLLTCVMPRPFIYRYLVYAKRVGNEAESGLVEKEESEEAVDEIEAN